jgi:hypothetical protein
MRVLVAGWLLLLIVVSWVPLWLGIDVCCLTTASGVVEAARNTPPA